jgi:hypothetical protein
MLGKNSKWDFWSTRQTLKCLLERLLAQLIPAKPPPRISTLGREFD